MKEAVSEPEADSPAAKEKVGTKVSIEVETATPSSDREPEPDPLRLVPDRDPVLS